MLERENIEKTMHEIYEYFETVTGEFTSLLHDDLSEEERGFYQLLIDFYEEMGTGTNTEEIPADFKETMHGIYNYCRTIPIQVGTCIDGEYSEKENHLYYIIENYFLPIRQKEIINRPFVI